MQARGKYNRDLAVADASSRQSAPAKRRDVPAAIGEGGSGGGGGNGGGDLSDGARASEYDVEAGDYRDVEESESDEEDGASNELADEIAYDEEQVLSYNITVKHKLGTGLAPCDRIDLPSSLVQVAKIRIPPTAERLTVHVKKIYTPAEFEAANRTEARVKEQLAYIEAQGRDEGKAGYVLDGIKWRKLKMMKSAKHAWISQMAVAPLRLGQAPKFTLTVTDVMPEGVSKDRPVTAFLTDMREVVVFRPRNHAAEQLAAPAAAAQEASNLGTPKGPNMVVNFAPRQMVGTRRQQESQNDKAPANMPAARTFRAPTPGNVDCDDDPQEEVHDVCKQQQQLADDHELHHSWAAFGQQPLEQDAGAAKQETLTLEQEQQQHHDNLLEDGSSGQSRHHEQQQLRAGDVMLFGSDVTRDGSTHPANGRRSGSVQLKTAAVNSMHVAAQAAAASTSRAATSSAGPQVRSALSSKSRRKQPDSKSRLKQPAVPYRSIDQSQQQQQHSGLQVLPTGHIGKMHQTAATGDAVTKLHNDLDVGVVHPILTSSSLMEQQQLGFDSGSAGCTPKAAMAGAAGTSTDSLTAQDRQQAPSAPPPQTQSVQGSREHQQQPRLDVDAPAQKTDVGRSNVAAPTVLGSTAAEHFGQHDRQVQLQPSQQQHHVGVLPQPHTSGAAVKPVTGSDVGADTAAGDEQQQLLQCSLGDMLLAGYDQTTFLCRVSSILLELDLLQKDEVLRIQEVEVVAGYNGNSILLQSLCDRCKLVCGAASGHQMRLVAHHTRQLLKLATNYRLEYAP